MRIKDLPEPVTASKADWLPNTTWLGFTPQGRGQNAHAQCQSTIQRQFGNGFILERITQHFGEPNAGFAADPHIEHERKEHEKVKDGLVAVHRLRTSARPLSTIIGKDEFERLQDIWATGGNRRRWSVAFPIIESYEILGRPRAREIFSDAVFKRLYQAQSATLRPLDDEARAAISDLEIVPVHAANAWIAIEDEIEIAMRPDSGVPRDVKKAINRDLEYALEGETHEHQTKIKLRAAWLANKFVQQRRRDGQLKCDECGFDPQTLPDAHHISSRSCFDVHHLHPLDEGVRYTKTTDFALLCPTCHRIEHLRHNQRVTALGKQVIR